MSGANVVVLVPNGRRQTVKCSPNTTILQILEEVCKKQGFEPNEYDIKHHNKVLDTTTTFRFSGLPNNAQLELTQALKSRTESNIILAVNLENGTRTTETFSPNDTLHLVLNKVCPDIAGYDKNPVVIYTRREIYGKELENCTLRSLGLIGGRAMIRVLNRPPETLHQQANVSAPLPSKPVEEKPYIRKFQPLEEPPAKTETEPDNQKTTCQDNVNDNSNTEDQKNIDEDVQNKSCNVKPQKNIKNTNVDLLKLAKEKRKAMESSPNKDHKEKKKNIECETKVIENQEPMNVDKPNSNNKSSTEKSVEDEFVFCGERNGMIFSLESAQSVPSEDLPDDFFDLTIDDAKKILRDVKRKRNELENQMLKTSQLRSLEESKKQLRQLNKYKKTIIRVQFPDRTVIQGTFKPTETVKDVLDFLKGYIEDQNLDFYIYTTPPKCVLEQESRLVEIGCVPGALLYFGSRDEKKEGYLKKQFQNMFTTSSVASLAAAKIRHNNTRVTENNDDDDDAFMEVINNDPAINQGASTSTDISNMERKVVPSKNYPKWFKPT
ncbi:tether containing UBX domain for GLUT4 [Rhynchophorus ferrugineus]|uniref:tether containing UBX domain for GLUT4 n=1 Tax=Rhynchophorus ferrugineus TaxID=354439 RepID=UPI003FCC49E0